MGDGERMTMTLPFVEAFGPTIQGEGPDAGRAASFVRFGGCNLSCSWCDSAYTWDADRFPLREQITLLGPDEVSRRIPDAPLLVITGGEPLLAQKREGWEEFAAQMHGRFPRISIETNGTIEPVGSTLAAVDTFVVSPKLSGVNMLRPRQARATWQGWGEIPNAHLKFVISDPADIDEALRVAAELRVPHYRVWLMPEGTTPAALAERWSWLAQAAANHSVNASHRLHILAWNDERGH